MELALAHRIAAPLERVEAVVLDPDRVARYPEAVPTVSSGELVRFAREPDGLVRVARFRVAEAYIPAGWLPVVGHFGWVEEVRWDPGAHAGRFAITPEIPERLRRRVTCAGTYGLARTDDGETLRRIDGALTVRLPLVGRVIEAQLRALLAAHFDAEARWLARDAGAVPSAA